MKTGVITFLLCFCIMISSAVPVIAEAGTGEYEGRYVRLKEGYLIAGSKKLFVKALDLKEKDQMEALAKMIQEGQVMLTVKEEVYVANIRPALEAARVKPRGKDSVMWTEIKALGAEAER